MAYAAPPGHTLAHASWDWLRQALGSAILPLKLPLEMTSRRPPELPDLTVIEPTFEGPGSQPMVPVPHLPVPPEDPAGIDSIHGPAPRRHQKPATPSPQPQPPALTLPLRTLRALGIPDLLAAK